MVYEEKFLATCEDRDVLVIVFQNNDEPSDSLEYKSNIIYSNLSHESIDIPL